MTLPDTVNAYIAAYNGKDAARMSAMAHADIAFMSISGGETTMRIEGRPAFAVPAEQACRIFAWRKQTVLDAITVGDFTAARIGYRAELAQDLANGWVKGQQIELTGRSLFELCEGRIIRLVDET